MSDDISESPDLSFGRFPAVVRRRWRAVTVGLLIGVLAAVAFELLVPAKVTATALVDANVISDQPFSKDRPESDLVDTATEEQLARSTTVVSMVSKEFGGDPTPVQVRASMVATLLPNSTVLRISYTDTTAERAARGVNILARGYVALRSDRAKNKIATIQAQVNRRQSALQRDLAAANVDVLQASSGGVARARAQARVQSVSADLSALAGQSSTLSSLDTTGGNVLAAGAEETATASPTRFLVVVSGVFGGLLLGLLLALGANRLDKRLRDEHEVEVAGGGGVLCRLSGKSGGFPPEGVDGDRIRELREQLLAVLPTGSASVTVADVSTRGAMSDIALNLAVLACGGRREVQLVVLAGPAVDLGPLLRTVSPGEPMEAGPFRRYASEAVEGLVLVLAADSQDPVHTPADALPAVLDRGDHAGVLTVVALAPGVGLPVQLAAGRLTQAFVPVVAVKETHKSQLAELSGRLRSMRTLVPGCVLVPRGRRIVAPTRAGATRHRVASRSVA